MMNEYLFKLTPADLSVIDKALQEMPFRLAHPLIAKINAQITAQTVAPETEQTDEPGR